MTVPLRLTTTLQARGPAAAIVLDDDQVSAVTGGPRTAPVTVTVNGSFTFAGRIARMGGENLVGLNAATRAAGGVAAGDTVDVEISLDGAERTVDVPDDLAESLADAGLTAAFAALAPSHRKEYVRWVTEAKKPETRLKRLAGTVDRVRDGAPRR